MPESPVDPLPVSLIVCRRVEVDAGTGGRTLVETLDRVSTMNWPVIWPELTVYLELTGGHGRVRVTVRIVPSDDFGEPVAEEALDAPLGDPLTTAHLVFAFHNLRFERPDAYRVQAWSGQRLLTERRLVIDQFEPPERAA